ncbi:muts domain V-domain-containing protein [Calycina marina]|uniref:DNA mismatch repair protein MSH5 n=1 Tax=Calycina marina TaxID=1763456 RepID=A0A9P7Z8Q1_9HELO|nr:muts domain V-domain-containing protein [Calycina marina]
MSYKRRIYGSGSSAKKSKSSSSQQPSSRRQSPSNSQRAPRLGPVPSRVPSSTPSQSMLPNTQRILAVPSSLARAFARHPSRDRDVIRANSTEPEDDIVARENSDAISEVVIAFEMKERGALGCAYYVAREEKLYMVEDIKMATLDTIDRLKLHAQPTVVLISTRAEESLEEHLKKEERGIDRGDDANDIFGAYILDSRPSSEFYYDGALSRLLQLELGDATYSSMEFKTPDDEITGGGQDGAGQQTRMMRLSGCMDLDSRLTIGCAGAVLSYISRRKNIDYLPNDEAALVAFRITSIEMFTLSGMMFINADTLASLQIIQSENHPNSHMQGPNKSTSGAKESLSVYGLFHHLASTPQGRMNLRQMFLRPSIDLSLIQMRLGTSMVLLRPDNESALEKLVRSLKEIKDMRSVVIHLQKGGTAVSGKGASIHQGVWASVQGFTFYTLKVMEALRELNGGETLDIVRKILTDTDPYRLNHLGQMVTRTVDFLTSAELHRTVVLPGVDEELDAIKRTYDGMESLLNEVAQMLRSELPEWAHNYISNCIFFPQLGFLTVVPQDPETGQGKYEGEGVNNELWERKFASDNMVYYKNNRMKEMDDHFGDTYGMICDREIEIIHSLSVMVLKHKDIIVAASNLCGELDSLVALALGARKYKFAPPQMTTANVIHIKGGRHPLQELTVPSYIPNDCSLIGGVGGEEDSDEPAPTLSGPSSMPDSVEGPSTLIMTGPNYSGKSVYLKQNALIVYMAHIGSFVPAERAIIGLTDKILTRIVTRESVSRNQSSFMIDLQQAALAMTLATRRSLIVIDEFGKGTNSVDGAGLACGVFEHFLNLGHYRPKVLGATHFHEIFESGFLKEREELTFGHMEVRVDTETEVVDEQVTYLYNFVHGRSISSFGTCCAIMNGIDGTIVERADQLILLAARGEDLISACARVSPEDAKELEVAEKIGRQLLEQDFPTDEDASVAGIRTILEFILATD